MRRFHGHFYNWYDLEDLSVLEPAYVSTVDSGNLAGHLIALRQACLALADEPVFDARIWRALETGAGAGGRAAARRSPPGHPARGVPQRGRARRWRLAAGAASRRRPGRGWPSRWQRARARRSTGSRAAAGRLAEPALGVDLLEPPADRGTRHRALDRRSSERREPLRLAPRAGGPVSPRRPSWCTRLEVDRRAGLRLRHGDGLPLPVRRRAEAVRHRLPASTPLAGRLVLRSARLRGAAGQLHRRRQERRAGGPLVPAGPHPDLRRGRAGAGVVERQHVRVPDADAGHALVPHTVLDADLRRARWRGRWPTATSAACPGE